MKKLLALVVVVVFTVILIAEVFAATEEVKISPRAWRKIVCHKPEPTFFDLYKLRFSDISLIDSRPPKVTVWFLEVTGQQGTVAACGDVSKGRAVAMYDKEMNYLGSSVAVGSDFPKDGN